MTFHCLDHRGTWFDKKDQDFLCANWTIKIRTLSSRSQTNSQCERTNGTLMKTINLALSSLQLYKRQWPTILSMALSAMRGLKTTHEQMFKSSRSLTVVGTIQPEFFQNIGRAILHDWRLRNKWDPLVEKFWLLEIISPYFAHIQFGNRQIVLTHSLVPAGQSFNQGTNPNSTPIL